VAIARWRPSNDLASLHHTMDRLFSDVFGDSFAGRGEGEGLMAPTYYLPVDIKETENGYLVEAPVPGFKPEDVEVTFSDGVLTINATRREEREEKEEGRYLRREIAFGNYQRRIALPGDVQSDNIKARFDDGVLRVEVPRASRPEPRRIEVQPGERARQEPSDASSEGSSDAAQASTETSSQPTEEGKKQPVEASSQS
jgi:HSP20 family protein